MSTPVETPAPDSQVSEYQATEVTPTSPGNFPQHGSVGIRLRLNPNQSNVWQISRATAEMLRDQLTELLGDRA